MDDTLRAALAAAAELEKLGVRWFLGGSLASSIHGVPRATFDADIMADIRPQHVRPFLRALGDDWYAAEGAMQDAIRESTLGVECRPYRPCGSKMSSNSHGFTAG